MAGTVIGEGLTIEGDLAAEEEIVVNGAVRGKLTTTDAVSVGSTGVVEADITGSSLSVAGQVTGDVNASERVDLQAGGLLTGTHHENGRAEFVARHPDRQTVERGIARTRRFAAAEVAV